jgi:hypothetical protein
MYTSISRVMCLALALAGAGFSVSPARAQSASGLDDRQWYTLAKDDLKAAGINPDDEGSLVLALRRRDGRAGMAALLLKEHTGNMVDGALLELVRSGGESEMVIAAYSLLAHGNVAWADEAAARLPTMKNRIAQINTAGALAKAGHHQGWGLIRAAIVEPRSPQPANTYPQAILATQALIQVPYFAGMKDEAGKPVNLSVELDKMHTEAPAENKKAILDCMTQFAPSPHPSERNKK